MIHGVKGAKYKSFSTMEEAESYLKGEDEVLPVCEEEKVRPKFSRKKNSDAQDEPYAVPQGTLVAFVDGSYDAKTKRYGFGCVLLTDDGRELTESGWGDHPEAVSSRNVAGELRATMTAFRRAEAMGYKNLRICHDYNGIAAWFKGEWKATSFVAREYVAVAESYRGVLNVTFEKIAAHTGVKYNEMADRLAKDALGIEY
jgi:ribonuclease HI